MMADEYAYPLLIKLEETNIPRLKIKLVKYFQSKKCNGGDCEVEYENGSRTALLHFRREEDQRNVLAKESHQISLEKGVLKLTVHSLPEEKSSQETPSDNVNKKCVSLTADVAATKGDDTVDEDLCSTSALLGNIPNNLNQEVLEMLVENIVKTHDSTSSSQSFTLEVLPDISSAVVTFQSAKDNSDFLERCPQNKMFTKKELSVRPLEVTNQVLVDDIHNISEEYLHLYFENEGGDVEDVTLNEVEQSAVITFKDHRAFKKIMKKKHSIKMEEIRVYPYYKSLGMALYGKDKPSLKLPAAISEPADSAVLTYLADNKSAAEVICSEMEKHFCNITLGQTDTVSLSPVPSLLKQKDAKVLIKEWSDTVKSAFEQSVSKFKSLKLHPETWEESEKKIREMLLNEDVIVVPDKASGVLSVAGLVSDINRLEKSLSEIIDKIAKMVHRQKSSKTEDIKVSPSIFHLLRQDGLEDKLLLVYPELKMSPESPNLKITGLGDEIVAARKVIFDAVLALKRHNLEIDDYVLESLKDEHQEELTAALLTSHQINTAFGISGNRVQLVAVSDRDLYNAQAHLTQLLTSQYISVEDSNVLKKPEWQQLVSQLEQANSKPCRTRISTTAQQVVVSGCKDNVMKVSSQLNDFLTQNAHIEKTVVVKSDTKTGFLAQLVDETDSVPKILCHFQTIEGVEIAVSKADMCSYPVHAVISPFNQNLKHGTNLAAALLKADDHQLQDECDKIIKKRGQLKTGDCVITDAGDQLCCKKVIHVVVPMFEKDKPEKALAQLKKAVKGSLEIAESHGCISVALPSIGRDLGFPPKQCELTIVKAVKEYCDENYDDITLQKIHLVNIDDSAIQDMVAAVGEEFGNYGVTHSQQTPPKTAQTSVLQPTDSNPHLCNEADEELFSSSAVLGNIPDHANQEFLEMLVENIVKVYGSTSSTQGFILEVLPDISSAVVTFQSGKENNDFMKHCFQNKMFTKMGLSVRPLEVTNQVLVDDIHNISEEYLHLYFEKEDLDVEDVTLNEAEQSAVITFKGDQAFKKIMKKKHSIKNEEIRVYPYYKSLGMALYGKDKPSLKLPAAICEPADSAVLRYLADNKSAAEVIHSEMEKHYCNITFSQKTVSLSPVSSLLKQKNAKVLIKEWSDTVKSAFGQSVSKFKSLKFHPDPEAWEESEKKIREKLLKEDVIVVPDKASGVLSVAGLVSDINRLEKSLSEIINKRVKNAQIEETAVGETDCVPKTLCQLKTPEGVEIAVCKADMCSYPVQAVVSPSNQDLKHNAGLAAALLKASGPQLQDECDKIIKRGQLKPGDCVITNAGGRLCCQKVIHAVVPKFEKDKPQKAFAQLRKAVKESLELAETHGCVSVALPSIGRGLGCFPLKQCELIIVRAVKEYCDETYDITLQKIHLVNTDDIAVQDMVAAVRQEFGNYCVTYSQQTPAPNIPKPSVSQPTGSDLYLYHKKTEEGVDIILAKGNIEAATTEVVVNTVSPDLYLEGGAVSNGILRAAGPKLQQLVNAQGASRTVGEIIVTEGCQLTSKKVFHAIAPRWDNGQGAAEKTLTGIFKDCLDMAEDNNLTSISLPAIGTGNMRFPKDLVASLILDKISEFSQKKNPKHLKKVVVVLYPGDKQTIQAFSDEFQKKFPHA